MNTLKKEIMGKAFGINVIVGVASGITALVAISESATSVTAGAVCMFIMAALNAILSGIGHFGADD
jgi:cytochrome bd-type quinol oxidase subunit 1